MRVSDRLTFFSLACLLAAALMLGAAAPLAGQSSQPGTRVFDAEELAEAGVYRLSDLYWLVDDWTAVSVNGYTWHAAPNGLADPNGAEWMLVIDGRPIHAGALNVHDINNIPLRIQDIERVKVSSLPRIVSGRVGHAGTIEIETRQPEGLFGVDGSIMPGSEIGDPGPYEYTRHATHNIDRYGPNYGATVSSNPGRWYVGAGFRDDERHASNVIRPRVEALCDSDCRIRGAPVVSLRAYHGIAGVESDLGLHRLSHYNTSLVDQLFFEPAGIEIPSNYRLLDTGLQWSAQVTDNLHLHYDAIHNSVTYGARVPEAAFDWKQDRTELRIELERKDERYQETFGFRGIYKQVQGERSLGQESISTLHLYRSLGYQITSSWHQYVAGDVNLTEGELGVTVLSSATFDLSERHALSLFGSYARRPLEEKQNLWYWMSEGYEMYFNDPQLERPNVALASNPGTSTTFTTDVFWNADFASTFQLEVQGGLRFFEGRTLPTYSLRLQENNHGLRPDVVLHDDAGGTVLSGSMTASVSLLPGLEQRFHAGYQHMTSSSDAFEQTWEKHPSLRLGYTVRYRPVSSVSLFGRLRYLDATSWSGYAPAAEEDPAWYTDRLSPSWQLHLTAQKHMWGDRLRLSISLRNMLDKPIAFHPAGAPVDMGFFLGAHLRL